jgi:hypothetical protein
VFNDPVNMWDVLGLFGDGRRGGPERNPNGPRGHSDLPEGDVFDFVSYDHNWWTRPDMYLIGGDPASHFQPLSESIPDVLDAIGPCDWKAYGDAMHRLQDYYAHYRAGYRFNIGVEMNAFALLMLDQIPDALIGTNLSKSDIDRVMMNLGHLWITPTHEAANASSSPDSDRQAWNDAARATKYFNSLWHDHCKQCGKEWVKR